MDANKLTAKELRAEIHKCARYLKPGESVSDRMGRYADEIYQLLGLLAKAKIASENAEIELLKKRKTLAHIPAKIVMQAETDGGYPTQIIKLSD